MEVKTTRFRFSSAGALEDELPAMIMTAEDEWTSQGYTIHHRMLTVVPVPEQSNRYYYTLWISQADMQQPMGPMQFQPARPPLK